jgi:hypothetical protein
MTDFEDELRAALQREEPPAGFANRVLTKTKRTPPRSSAWIPAAIAACLLLSVGGVEYRQYEGRKAKRELLLALEITENKLSVVQKKISELNQRTIHE